MLYGRVISIFLEVIIQVIQDVFNKPNTMINIAKDNN